MQKDVIINMTQQGYEYEEIQTHLQKEFGDHAYKRSAIYKYRQIAKGGFEQEEKTSNHENFIDQQLLITIRHEVLKDHFFLIRSLARKLNCQKNLVYRYITEELNYVYKHTR